MPSYQNSALSTDSTGRWLTFSATVAVSAATRDWLAAKITQRRQKIRSRWRLLDPTTQACGVPVRGSAVLGFEWRHGLGISAGVRRARWRGAETRYTPSGSAQRDQAARRYSWIKPPSTSTRCTAAPTVSSSTSLNR
jgi:hypothetical protein